MKIHLVTKALLVFFCMEHLCCRHPREKHMMHQLKNHFVSVATTRGVAPILANTTECANAISEACSGYKRESIGDVS